MNKVHGLIAVFGLALVAGCYNDRPHDYGQQRPPVENLDPRDSGLQSKDLVVATDEMVRDLMTLSELNASRAQWTIVFTNMDNQTTDPRFDYNIFLGSLKTKVFKASQGRVTVIENRDRLKNLQNKELERERDDFGQGERTGAGPAGIQPDYAMYGIVQEMPNRATSTFRMEFTLTQIQGGGARRQVWTNEYLVKVAR